MRDELEVKILDKNKWYETMCNGHEMMKEKHQ
jgi:hypothetical protein